MNIILNQDIIDRFNSGCNEFKDCHTALTSENTKLYKEKSRKSIDEIFGALEYALKKYVQEKKSESKNIELVNHIDKKFPNLNRFFLKDAIALFENYKDEFIISMERLVKLKKIKELERNTAEHDSYTPNYDDLKEGLIETFHIISNQFSSELTNLTNVDELLSQLEKDSIISDVEPPILNIDYKFNVLETNEEINVVCNEVKYLLIEKKDEFIKIKFDLEDAIKHEIKNIGNVNDITSRSKLVSCQ